MSSSCVVAVTLSLGTMILRFTQKISTTAIIWRTYAFQLFLLRKSMVTHNIAISQIGIIGFILISVTPIPIYNLSHLQIPSIAIKVISITTNGNSSSGVSTSMVFTFTRLLLIFSIEETISENDPDASSR